MRTRRLLASIGVPMLLALGAAPAATAAADPVVGQAGAADRQRLLFGIGPELDSARRSGLVRDGRVGMLTSWYSGPGDLAWMRHWRTTEVPRAYRAGYALHLVIHANDPEVDGETPYGRACGRVYPLTGGFLDHLRQLGRIFGGAASGPPLYVTMFTEFQTYPCRDNAWAPDRATTAYYRQLKDQYRAAVAVLHRAAPNVRVSLGWGGWQARWNDAAHGGGRSMLRRFADVMALSDFQSFQAMESTSNIGDITAMTRLLGAHGPVMLAHYKPDDGGQATFDADVRRPLTAPMLRRLRGDGLFALSFMDGANLDGQAGTLAFVSAATASFGAAPRPRRAGRP